ncbi:LLM class flavin-dependent oxidoreductase [Candidatus Acetothermia bacterium]|nr:LLM class flavin-dependent oxidoreductase [Candidatus Acetothermia bacterium]
MQVGIWLPVFGGWLRNVADERMESTFEYSNRVAQRADELGFSTILVAELNLNDIKGPQAPSLEAWTTISALAVTTKKIRLMAALRPGFRWPAIAAKMAANIDHISGGRFEINLVSAWWKEEMEMYIGQWLDHSERYRRSREFLHVMKGVWTEPVFNYEGNFYRVQNCVLEPKPIQKPWPPVYAGGESEEARTMIATECDVYLMHGDSVEVISKNIVDMRARRARVNEKPLKFGMAAYVICRDTEAEAQAELERITRVREDLQSYHSYKDFVTQSQLKTQLDLRDYSVSNRGLRPNFVGTPEQIVQRIKSYEKTGLDLILIQCSPMLEELERIGTQILPELQREGTVVA